MTDVRGWGYDTRADTFRPPSNLSTHHHDDVDSGAWKPWDPQLVNATLGNGTLAARYSRLGRTITASFFWTFGSTSDITGAFSVANFPFAVNASTGSVGIALMRDNSIGNRSVGLLTLVVATGTIYTATGGTPVAETQPWDWATSDSLQFTITYEAASL